MKRDELVRIIDHTNIWPQATLKDIERLCREAVRYKFGCVCINPIYVKLAVRLLKGKDTLVGATCGFPFGAHLTKIKIYEAAKAIHEGASHIDMVMNIGALKSKEYKIVEKDIRAIVSLGAVCKVILEMNLLTQKEKVTACKIASSCGADFLKTGTGLWGKALISDVKLMSKYGLVKAAGGIRTYREAQRFVNAGAARIGTSNSVSIVNDYEKNANLRKAH